MGIKVKGKEHKSFDLLEDKLKEVNMANNGERRNKEADIGGSFDRGNEIRRKTRELIGASTLQGKEKRSSLENLLNDFEEKEPEEVVLLSDDENEAVASVTELKRSLERETSSSEDPNSVSDSEMVAEEKDAERSGEDELLRKRSKKDCSVAARYVVVGFR